MKLIITTQSSPNPTQIFGTLARNFPWSLYCIAIDKLDPVPLPSSNLVPYSFSCFPRLCASTFSIFCRYRNDHTVPRKQSMRHVSK